MTRFYSYDHDHGFEEHETLEQAKAAAKESLEIARDQACNRGEWNDEVDAIEFGQLVQLGKATEVEQRTDPDTGDEFSDWRLEEHEPDTRTMPYEPLMPRCATCQSFAILDVLYAGNERKAVCSLSIRRQPWYIPADGSGYCHEHSAVKRG